MKPDTDLQLSSLWYALQKAYKEEGELIAASITILINKNGKLTMKAVFVPQGIEKDE